MQAHRREAREAHSISDLRHCRGLRDSEGWKNKGSAKIGHKSYRRAQTHTSAEILAFGRSTIRTTSISTAILSTLAPTICLRTRGSMAISGKRHHAPSTVEFPRLTLQMMRSCWGCRRKL